MSRPRSDQSFDANPALVPKSDGNRDTRAAMASPVSATTEGTTLVDCRPGLEDTERRSINSYTSSLDREFTLKELHGRTINNTNDFYLMPADVDEHTRLDIQHQALKVKQGALYWPSHQVRRIMAPRPDGVKPPAVLDIGTGAGSWAIDMAEEFPHVEVVGLDIVPANTSRSIPANCRFECDDVNQGLDHYKGHFDLVHMRCVDSGIEDARTFYHQLPDLLRPGGILLVVLAEFMRDEDGEIIVQEDQNAPDFSWVAKMSRTYVQVAIDRAAKLLPDKADRSGSLSVYQYQNWMKETAAWEAQAHQKSLIPLGPWKPNMSETDRFVSEVFRQNFSKVAGAWRPALLTHGYPEAMVDEWIAKAREEIVNMKPHTYVGYQASWALKPGSPRDDAAM